MSSTNRKFVSETAKIAIEDIDLKDIETLIRSLGALNSSVNALRSAIHKLNTHETVSEAPSVSDQDLDLEESLKLIPKPTVH